MDPDGNKAADPNYIFLLDQLRAMIRTEKDDEGRLKWNLDLDALNKRAAALELLILNDPRQLQISALFSFLREVGFYESPASTKYHLCCKHGLLAHSVSVTAIALEINRCFGFPIPEPSLALCGYVHDIGKLGSFGEGFVRRYEPNVLKKGNISEAQPWKYSEGLITIPLAVQSLYLVSKFVDLAEAEQQGILAHDGQYIPENRGFAHNEMPLTLLLHFADMLSCTVIEEGLSMTEGYRGQFTTFPWVAKQIPILAKKLEDQKKAEAQPGFMVSEGKPLSWGTGHEMQYQSILAEKGEAAALDFARQYGWDETNIQNRNNLT